MNARRVVIGFTIIVLMSGAFFPNGYTEPIEDQMIPGMLTEDAPYYKYNQDEDDSVQSFEYIPPEITGSIDYWIEQIDESIVLSYIQNLVDFGPRVTESSACDEAGTYIYNEFCSMGLEAEYHNWTSGYLNGKNVVATLDGLDPTSDKIFVVLGHYDSVSGSPGADDNAGGVTSSLAAAEVLSQYRFKHTIRFLVVDGEEQGLHGSSEYAEKCANNEDNIIAALNADMIGYAPNEGDGDFVNIYTNTASEWLYWFIENISMIYSSDLNGLQTIDDGYISNSDHASFVSEGYDAACYHEYHFNDYYHSPNDLIEHMNMTYDTMVTRLIVATLAELAEPIVYEHDLLVSDLTIPSTVPHGETQTVQATITNVGNNTETNIIIDFIVNDSIENSKIIPSLARLDSTLVNFSWNPDYGSYHVEVESQSVQDEEDLSNNNVNKTVDVISAPAIEVNPTDLTFLIPTDATDTDMMTISNLASAETVLDYSISYNGDLGGSWLSATPSSGSIPISDSESVTITVDTTGLAEGDYTGQVIISSN
ncbi:MAG TPA: M28 family peptidase, partial [Candidatus Thermoplasmatota archaeon]|nr:M28 family peptidase [Candidatus Thermoplasmatota archaeon]